jgi:hypothetical protein
MQTLKEELKGGVTSWSRYCQAQEEPVGTGPAFPATTVLIMLGMIGIRESPGNAFTAYNCTNRSNVVESYTVLEPDACATSDGNREFELLCLEKLFR